MSLPILVYLTPHDAGAPGLPSRPASLLAALVLAGAFDHVLVINRRRPGAVFNHVKSKRPFIGGWLAGLQRRLADGVTLIEHPWPFGPIERQFVQGVLATCAKRTGAQVVAWVADPKSVAAVTGARASEPRWLTVVDAYDAWDRSPLVRGARRRRAVSDGYQAGALRADLVFANTLLMRDRLVDLGARNVRHLPNACPSVDPGPTPSDGRRAGLVYVGRIHERFDTHLVAAVADALSDTTLTIAGPVERVPEGWPDLVRRPNVLAPGRLDPAAARDLIGQAAGLILPHRVDSYTRSQDAMKAWDAIASGTPVITTRIPPADGWPTGLAEVCSSTEAFVEAARRAVDGQLESGRPARLAYAAGNQWSARASAAITAINELLPTRSDA